MGSCVLLRASFFVLLSSFSPSSSAFTRVPLALSSFHLLLSFFFSILCLKDEFLLRGLLLIVIIIPAFLERIIDGITVLPGFQPILVPLLPFIRIDVDLRQAEQDSSAGKCISKNKTQKR